ncbi:DNA polymerase I [Desulfogranum japonicum]|uniref:DNA polymerase I n=1 Tax=Desulfogranum japonicum TaxID=231447 RepID=UPI000550391B|nr:DNA polymerase I [Desulfogranum japonicum]
MVKPVVYLIDGSAYIYRAYHAIKPLSNSSGLPTHAVFGFATILKKLMNEKQPEYLAIAFDTRGKVFRHDMYADYKANRPPMPEDLAVQIPHIRSLVRAYNILSLEESTQEADDLIASATSVLTLAGCEVVIVSGDKDLMQLVSESVRLWDPMNDRLMDIAAVEKKYGLPPERLLDYFAMVGDSSDNVPGVPGVGPKTALKYLEQYGNLDNFYQHLDELKQNKTTQRIRDHQADAFLSRDLIRLNHEAPVPEDLAEYICRPANNEALRSLFTELEFHTLLKNEVHSAKVDTSTFSLVSTEEELIELVERLRTAKSLVIDTETDSLDVLQANLVGISVCMDENAAWYLPCGHVNENGDRQTGQLELQQVVERLRPLLEDERIEKIGHNIKYDLAVLRRQENGNIQLNGPLFDTMVGAWLLDPGRRSYKLDDLCEAIDMRLTSFAEVVQGDKREDAFTRVSLEDAANYSCEDVFAACTLYQRQVPELETLGMMELYRDLEGPLISLLQQMEANGVLVDGELLQQLSLDFATQLAGCEQEIYTLAGKEFNIQSPKQLGDVLFEDLQLPKGRKTKTGWSTDVKVLEKLAGQHELPAKVLHYRNLAKLKSTYVDKLAELRHANTGRVHTSFNQCGTATGRLSSSNPNLQNIPIRTAEGRRIREAFIAPQGHALISGDYSQIDLRVMAHYSKDEKLLEAFLQGEDIHRRTASQIFFVAPELVTSEMRRVAKTINFGIVYGMSSFGLASQLDLSRKEAQTFIDRYFDHFAGIRQFMDKIVEQARENGFVSTLFGRRRPVPDILNTNKSKREFAERIAINTPIQGTAADVMKAAMLRVNRALNEGQYQSRMILQVHDELVLEVPDDEHEEVMLLLKREMEAAAQLAVPLTVHVQQGQNLGKE